MESHRTLSCSSSQCCCPSNLGGPAARRTHFAHTCLPTCMIRTTAVRPPAPVVAARHTLSGWEECADASLFALLRDKLKSGKTEQAFELKDTQRLKKHVQQVGHACSSKLSPRCACFAPRAQARRPRAGHRPAHREPVGSAVMLSGTALLHGDGRSWRGNDD